MTRKRPDELSPAARRRVLTLSLVRAAASAAVLVVVYYLAPLDRSPDAGTWIGFVVGLVVFAVVVVMEVRAITESDVPRLRAVQAFAISLPTLLLLFAATYVVIANGDPNSFSEPLSRTDSLYFTLTVFATVGFGDIVPRTEVARVITMLQMIMGLIAVGLVARIVVGAVQVADKRRKGENPESAPTDERGGGA